MSNVLEANRLVDVNYAGNPADLSRLSLQIEYHKVRSSMSSDVGFFKWDIFPSTLGIELVESPGDLISHYGSECGYRISNRWLDNKLTLDAQKCLAVIVSGTLKKDDCYYPSGKVSILTHLSPGVVMDQTEYNIESNFGRKYFEMGREFLQRVIPESTVALICGGTCAGLTDIPDEMVEDSYRKMVGSILFHHKNTGDFEVPTFILAPKVEIGMTDVYFDTTRQRVIVEETNQPWESTYLFKPENMDWVLEKITREYQAPVSLCV